MTRAQASKSSEGFAFYLFTSCQKKWEVGSNVMKLETSDSKLDLLC